MAGDVLSRLGLVGLSHRTAPASLRDRIAAEEAMAVVWADRFAGPAAETLVLVTCDRVETFLVADDPAEAVERAAADFAAAAGLERLGEHGYRRLATDAARHLFRIGASLDSMVVGEPQVLGQLKEADRRARQAGRVGPVLDWRCPAPMPRPSGCARRPRSASGRCRSPPPPAMSPATSTATCRACRCWWSAPPRWASCWSRP